jgi:hypothetical protein
MRRWRLAASRDRQVRSGLWTLRQNDHVVAMPVAAPRSTARSGLLVVGGLFAGGFALSALFATTGFGVPCPFLALTGWQCPLCGGTRMGAALLHGDLASAYGFNPLVLIVMTVLGALAMVWAIEIAGGPAARPARSLTKRLEHVPAVAWLLLALVLAVVYTVVRNLS